MSGLAAAARPARALPATALWVTAMGVGCALLIGLPARTVTNAFVNDLLIFLDGAHRLVWGQVPNVDFHAALGPLTYIIPAAGLKLSGQLGGAMTVGMALTILALLPIMAHVIGSRLRPVLGLPFAAFLILLLAVPANLGADLSQMSFAMFYNRIGWAHLALLLVMFVPPQGDGRRQTWLDAACAAALVVMQCYTKSTYGAVAIAFVLFMLSDRRQRRWAALALGIGAATALLVELVWQGSRAYVGDLLLAARVSGGRDLEAVARGVLNNLPDVVLFAVATGLALWVTRSARLAIFALGCLASGALILSQNAHGWGIITLFAGAVAAAELAMRARPAGAPGAASFLVAGTPLLLVALLLPPVVRHATTLALHFGLALSDFGEPLPLPAMEEVRHGYVWPETHNGFAENYIASFAEGAAALAALDTPIERVVVLDFANPFSAGLGVAPARGDNSWLHWNRNVDEETFLPPEEIMGDAKFVMVPRWGVNGPPLFDVYQAHLDRHFRRVAITEQWTIFMPRDLE
jgi:hypothetical protein